MFQTPACSAPATAGTGLAPAGRSPLPRGLTSAQDRRPMSADAFIPILCCKKKSSPVPHSNPLYTTDIGAESF
jgi:hypothetical protein